MPPPPTNNRMRTVTETKWEDIALTCKKTSKSDAFISCIIWFRR
jgi:hypothetical protein